MSQLLKFIGAGDKIGFAVDLNQSTNAPAGMNIGLDKSLIGRTFCLLLCLKDTFLPQNLEGLFGIALCFKKGIASGHNPGA